MSLGNDITQLAEGLLGKGPDDPWGALVDGGLTALAVPEENGGEGLGATEAALVLTALGRRAAASPALVTTVASLALARYGRPEQCEAALRPVAEDGAALTVALSAPLRARRTSEGLRLDGTAPNVPFARTAHRMLVPVRIDGAPGLAIVDPAGTTLTDRPTSSGSPSQSVGFEGTPGDLVERADLQRIAGAGAAAYADGLVAGALALTAEHVGTRHQFGRPLVTLQAAAMQLADVAIVASTVHLVAVAAAAALDSDADPDGFADPEVAALLATDDVRTAIATCHHLHGGTGLDVTYPLPAFSAAATDLAHLLGDRLGPLADRLERAS